MADPAATRMPGRLPERMHARVVAAVLAADAPGLPAAEESEVRRYVLDRVRGAPAHLRLGIDGVAAVLAVACAGGPVSAARLDRWTTSRLPPVATYVKLIRGLVLFATYERRIPV